MSILLKSPFPCLPHIHRDEADEFVEIGALNGIFVLGRSMGFIGELSACMAMSARQQTLLLCMITSLSFIYLLKDTTWIRRG